jgi:hypothetical protein
MREIRTRIKKDIHREVELTIVNDILSDYISRSHHCIEKWDVTALSMIVFAVFITCKCRSFCLLDCWRRHKMIVNPMISSHSQVFYSFKIFRVVVNSSY